MLDGHSCGPWQPLAHLTVTFYNPDGESVSNQLFLNSINKGYLLEVQISLGECEGHVHIKILKALKLCSKNLSSCVYSFYLDLEFLFHGAPPSKGSTQTGEKSHGGDWSYVGWG